MIFDTLCGIVEKNYPYLQHILRNAKLFEFPEVPHKVLPKQYTEDPEWLEDSFFLPFPIVAVEDKASCVVLWDTIPKQTGTQIERGFIECLHLSTPLSHFREFSDGMELSPEMRELGRKQNCLVSIGGIHSMKVFPGGREFIGNGYLKRADLASKRGMVVRNIVHEMEKIKVAIKNDRIRFKDYENEFDSEAITRAALTNAYATVQEILHFNQPHKFILEESPLKTKKKQLKIPRSGQRPKYTLLTPRKIRERMGLKNPHNRKSPIIHERQRHYRWLSAENYSKDKDGKPLPKKTIPIGPRKGQSYYKYVIIGPTWVGPSKNVYKNKHYKVILPSYASQ
jgi:hypothetical protein